MQVCALQEYVPGARHPIGANCRQTWVSVPEIFFQKLIFRIFAIFPTLKSLIGLYLTFLDS